MYPIYSTERDRGYILTKLRDGWNVRLEHLLKLYFYPMAVNYHNSWIRSVWTSCGKIPSLDNKGKRYLTASEILQSIWYDKIFNTVSDIHCFVSNLKKVVSAMSNYPSPAFPLRNGLIEDFQTFCASYHKWLAEELSKYGKITQEECSQELSRFLSGCVYWVDYKNANT